VLLITPKPDHTKNIVYAIAFVITIFMAVYIWYKMRTIKRTLLEEQDARRERRRAAMQVEVQVAGSKSPGNMTPQERQGSDQQWLLAGTPRGAEEYDAGAQEEGLESISLTEVRVPFGMDGEAPPKYEPERPARAFNVKETGRDNTHWA